MPIRMIINSNYHFNGGNYSLDPLIIAAIITAAGVIIAAVIQIRKGQSGKKAKTTIKNRDGNVINVNDQGSVNISMHSDNNKETSVLITKIDQITEYASAILVENQKILSNIYQTNPNVQKMQSEFSDLYHIQYGRAKFKEWLSYLSQIRADLEDQALQNYVSTLRSLVSDLRERVYKPVNEDSLPLNKKGLLSRIETMQDIEELKIDIDFYLSNLRELTEDIGDIAGRIKAHLGG